MRLYLSALSYARDIVVIAVLGVNGRSFYSSGTCNFSIFGSSFSLNLAIILNDFIASSSLPALRSHLGDSGKINTTIKTITESIAAT